MHNRDLSALSSIQENYVLQALADVRKLIFYKLTSIHRDSAEDLMQRVFCKIWSWKTRYNKTLEFDDWKKLTKTVVYREISEFFGEKYTHDVLFSQLDIDHWEEFFKLQSFKNSIEGNTRTETDSLILSFWNAAQILSLRQRYAFVLCNENFLIEFINSGYCKFEELASYFDLRPEIFSGIMELIPLSESEIGELLSEKLNVSVTADQIWQARSKAKARLIQHLKQLTK
jgi:hypothetical protein